MVRVMFWLQLLLVVFILRQSAADSNLDGSSEDEKCEALLKRVEALEHGNERDVVSQYYVISRHYDTATCSLMLCA
jgi:hypothetical protein